MGYMRHHVIIITSWNQDLLKKAHLKAKEIFPIVSEIYEGVINNYKSFFIPPDGSKEGWNESNEGDKNRQNFVEWLDAQRYSDNSTSLDWVEVQYGDDERETKIVRHSDERPTGD